LARSFGALPWAATGASSLPYLADIQQAHHLHILYAKAGGAVFNVANLLLVAAIDIAGLAVAFPVGIGLALVVGVLLNYLLSPRGNPALLFGGVLLVTLAIVLDALAYRRRESGRKKISSRGLWCSYGRFLSVGS
jgi:glucose uptake protein